MSENLIARARERAETSPLPEGWGYRVKLDTESHFVGRWRGETVDEDNDNRRIFLFWDEDGALCFSRSYAALDREIDRLKPWEVGDDVAVYRGVDYLGEKGTGYSFGVEKESSTEPLPEGSAPAPDDDIPF